MIINTPPGSSKSLFWAVLWPAWEWTAKPWTRWLTASYDDGLAIRDAVRTRRLMATPWYREQVSLDWQFVGDQNVKSNYVNDKTGWRIAASMNGEITGNHAHRVLVDDPHHVRRVESDLQRESTVTIWREVFPSRVLPSGSRIMIGQRTHEEDAVADWLDREGDSIHHVELREEYERPRTTNEAPSGESAPSAMTASRPQAASTCSLTGHVHDPRTREGELLTPARFSAKVIERRKIELGPYAYSAQYQQAPSPRTGSVLDPAWFPQTPVLERSTVDLVAAFDLNYSESETSDWTVGLLGAVDRDPVLPMIHVIDRFAGHLAEKDHDARISEWLLLWRPMMVTVEKRAWEKQGATKDLCRRIVAICEEKGYSPNIEPVEADLDKITRAMIIPGRARYGRITFDRRRPWWSVVARQMSQFPRSAHDDDVDALAYLVRLVVEKLQTIRGQQNLLGHHAEIEIREAGTNGQQTDQSYADAMGMR